MKATQAIRLLKDIPEEDFIVMRFSDEKSKCCVIGHLTRLTSKDPNDYSYPNCNDYLHSYFRTSSREFFELHHPEEAARMINQGWHCDISLVNNGADINGYNESSIKARVMHLLEDMDKAGY